MDEKTWKQRNHVSKKAYKNHSSWVKGYEAGKEGVSKNDNPYLKQLDQGLMRKATYWEIGRELAAFNLLFRDKRLEKQRKENEKYKKKQERKEKRWKEKHKDDRKKHKRRHKRRHR